MRSLDGISERLRCSLRQAHAQVRVLILGASGMLGFALHRILHDDGYDVIGTLRRASAPGSLWCRQLKYVFDVDVRRIPETLRRIQDLNPSFVINATGIKNLPVDECGYLSFLAVNAGFPRILSFNAQHLGVRVIHFSTDGVFSGQRGNYTEECSPDPQDLYGLTKLLGESSNDRTLVLRTSMIGQGVEPNEALLDWFLRQSGVVHGYSRAVFSGLTVIEIANVLATKILPLERPLTGLYHLSGSQISKFELLTIIKSVWSLNAVTIEPNESVCLNRTLDSSRLSQKIAYEPPDWSHQIHAMRDFYSALDSLVPSITDNSR